MPAVPPGMRETVRALEPARALRQVVPDMRAAGAQVVVVLSHMIHADTRRVLREVEGVDVALGTHLGLPTAQPEGVGGALLAVAGPDELQALGQLDLTVHGGRIVRHRFHRHVPSPATAADDALEAALERHLERLSAASRDRSSPAECARRGVPVSTGRKPAGYAEERPASSSRQMR
jgi:2',3'-cyclic-nucleotide 2'-phosphodiesterase (5'-nucleotidase family)